MPTRMQTNSEPARWMTFQAWLAQQRGGRPASKAGDSDACADRAAPAAEQPERRRSLVPERAARALVPNMSQDCRYETRMVDHVHGRQETTVSLTLPGLSGCKAPVITAKQVRRGPPRPLCSLPFLPKEQAPLKPLDSPPPLAPLQAGALLSTLSEPLVKVRVGRLTRRLNAPTVLTPTGERGTLSLWLQPNDDISLMWQSAVPEPELAAAAAAAAAAAGPARPAAEGGDARQAACSVSVWEELAHFPADLHPEANEPRESR